LLGSIYALDYVLGYALAYALGKASGTASGILPPAVGKNQGKLLIPMTN
jgi:hypothetical protein